VSSPSKHNDAPIGSPAISAKKITGLTI